METDLQIIIDAIHDMTGKSKKLIKDTIEEMMASDDDFSGHWAETGEILVRSQEPDKYHYDIYLKVGTVWARNWLKHKHITPDYKPTVDKRRR